MDIIKDRIGKGDIILNFVFDLVLMMLLVPFSVAKSCVLM